MIHIFGQLPVKMLLVHGGPGAHGDLRSLAQSLAHLNGIAEPWQSKSSVDELIEELAEQIKETGTSPAILFGHSWGAWLSGLTAARYPELVSKLIFSGSPAFEEKYNQNLMDVRMARLTEEESEEFITRLRGLATLSKMENQESFARLNYLMKKADSFALADVPQPGGEIRMDLFGPVWAEASEMRKTGILLKHFSGIQCPVTLIHGKNDPHPVEGAVEPLKNISLNLKVKILSKCGHYPWLEQFAKEEFYTFLLNEVRQN